MITDSEIKNLLYEHEKKINPNWINTFKNLEMYAIKCNELLKKVQFFRWFRGNERSKKTDAIFEAFLSEYNKKRGKISKSALDGIWQKIIDKQKDQYPGDMFYYPGHVTIDNQNTCYSNEMAYKDLGKMLDASFKPQLIQREIISYSLSLKKAFFILEQEKNPPMMVLFRLWAILENIYLYAEDEWKKVELSEMKVNSASMRKQNTLQDIRENENYGKIKDLLIKAEKARKIDDKKNVKKLNKQINKAIEKIVGEKSPNTVKNYQKELLKDFNI